MIMKKFINMMKSAMDNIYNNNCMCPTGSIPVMHVDKKIKTRIRFKLV